MKKHFDEDDVYVVNAIKKSLDDPNSALNHFLQFIAVRKDFVENKISLARKETESLMKLSGELGAFREILSLPEVILQRYKEYSESKKNDEEIMEVVGGGIK